MKKLIFSGSGVAIVTPFNPDMSINFDKLGSLIDFQIENGTDALIICGTTGETSTLTDEEHKNAIKFAVEKVNGRIPVIAGTGSNDTQYAIELAKYAREVGADAQLSVTPYYNKTTQKGLVKHFFAIAEATSLPVILYNVPSRTGMNILPETYRVLSEHPNIYATKEANGDVAATIETRKLCGEDFAVYSGEDSLITPLLSVGAVGVISVIANMLPRQTHDICKSFFDGNIEKSKSLQTEYISLIKALFSETNPIPIKAAMNAMGFDVGNCRLPLCEMEPQNLNKLLDAMKNVGISV